MSRYSKIIEKDGKKTEVVWGYDPPLQEYFLQEFNPNAADDEEDCIFSISSISTLEFHPRFPGKFRYKNSEILELMSEYDVIPDEHKQAVAMDLPY